MERTITIGTRGSDLALWQANYVKDKLAEININAELKIIKTQGDHILNLRLDKLEGKGFFTKELEEHLLEGSIDLAVHSHKDLPTKNPPGLIIAAVSEREDPSEVILILKDCVDSSKKLSVKHNATVGTSSNRRQSQLFAVRPDLEFENLRGNVNTRIQKLRDENYDAIIMAKAGINRLKLDLSEFYIEEIEPTAELVPAPAQGVLAVQIRENDDELNQILQHIHNKEIAEEIGVERKVLNLFDGGCHMPLGCYCKKEDGLFHVWTTKALDQEDFPDRLYITSETTEGLAERIVAKFDVGNRNLPKKVFISRELSEYSYFHKSLKKNDVEVEARSLIRTVPTIHKIDSYIFKHVDWIFFSSKNGIEYFFALDPILPKELKFGVVGRGSEEALKQLGKVVSFIGDSSDTAEVAEEFATIANGKSILFPSAKESLRTIQQGLSPDTEIMDLVIYETILEDNIQQSFADVLVFTSPSNVEAYFQDNLLDPGQKVVAIGKSTGKKFDEMDVSYILPASPDEIGLAEVVFGIDI
ncbi:MAG: hydroxymethylbilane synthase [Bacteroidetes bacterium]|nr:hydroxymethylbilane synthase [Bacteroidota bacterium]MBU1373814.1 hydroxymethylbilane synthase [Bacteroidota bacterium]MBU1483861.1 hydroxymethylbilane synthase [Bacteroidota bacterium]MBU1761061.1 hydroxymethylbilane synthase [Bacteroidota bacterium]MBU2266965.1 hydroxymethylbilane synthase [Bacteroidota bacterium]